MKTNKNLIKPVILLLLLNFFAVSGFTQQNRNILKKELATFDLNAALINDFSELNFPNYKTRAFWNDLPEHFKATYIKDAEEALKYEWPGLRATDYLEILRSGDRKHDLNTKPVQILTALVMGELVEGKGRFIDPIANGVWYYSELTWWGWSAHLFMQKAYDGLPDSNDPVIDLGVGEVANTLAWTYFLFKNELDEVHPLITKRLKEEINKKVLQPYYQRSDFWWQGFVPDEIRNVNNWNPWTNFNMLTAILIFEDDSIKRSYGVRKVIKSVDEFLNFYPEDGGCDEGPSYWGHAGASLFQNLELLKSATKGNFDVYGSPLIQNIGSYIYKAFINYPYVINFADADAQTGSKPYLIYRFGHEISDTVMQKFGAFLANQQNWGAQIPGGKIDEQIAQLLLLKELENAPAENALISDFWLPNIEVAGARDKAGSTKGFYFAAKGGHNNESHNHNDLGTCVLYYDGKPCLIDLGRETYRAQTFDHRRYSIWVMQSGFHQLPVINGVEQKEGESFRAKNTTFNSNETMAEFSTDISGAYPKEAAVKKWVRTYRLNRGSSFEISDSWELEQLKNQTTSLNFITYCKVIKTELGTLKLQGDGFELFMKYNSKLVTPSIEFHEVKDDKLSQYWPEGVSRIVFKLNNPKLNGKNSIEILK